MAAGHAVGQVVDADHGQVHVAPGRMDEVVAANGKEVAVAGKHDNLQLRVGHFDAGGKGDGPAMGGVEAVELDVARTPGRTTDPRDHGELVVGQAGGLDGAEAGGKDRADAAARAPDVGDAVGADQIVQRVFRRFGQLFRMNGHG